MEPFAATLGTCYVKKEARVETHMLLRQCAWGLLPLRPTEASQCLRRCGRDPRDGRWAEGWDQAGRSVITPSDFIFHRACFSTKKQRIGSSWSYSTPSPPHPCPNVAPTGENRLGKAISSQ